MDGFSLKAGTVLKETPFPARLHDRIKAENCTRKEFARFLRVGYSEINKWTKGKFPAQRYWQRLIEKGVATEGELKEWKPKAKRRINMLGGRVFRVRTKEGVKNVAYFRLSEYANISPVTFAIWERFYHPSIDEEVLFELAAVRPTMEEINVLTLTIVRATNAWSKGLLSQCFK